MKSIQLQNPYKDRHGPSCLAQMCCLRWHRARSSHWEEISHFLRHHKQNKVVGGVKTGNSYCLSPLNKYLLNDGLVWSDSNSPTWIGYYQTQLISVWFVAPSFFILTDSTCSFAVWLLHFTAVIPSPTPASLVWSFSCQLHQEPVGEIHQHTVGMSLVIQSMQCDDELDHAWEHFFFEEWFTYLNDRHHLLIFSPDGCSKNQGLQPGLPHGE